MNERAQRESESVFDRVVSVPILHVGGCCDSENPRKVHIDRGDGEPLCGQYFEHIERRQADETPMEPTLDVDEWCRKCVKIYKAR